VDGARRIFSGLQKNLFLQGYAQVMEQLPQVVLLLESSRGAGRALLRGFANYARYHGPWAFDWEPGGLNEIWPRLSKSAIQGAFLRDGKYIKKILALGIPTVIVGHRKEDFPDVAHVVTDSEAAGRLAAEHLLGCGFKNFAFYGPSCIRWSTARRESFQGHLEKFGRAVHFFDAPAEGEGTSRRTEHVVMGRWLKSLLKPVGVMACNDDYAHQLVEACKTARLHVPDQVGIVGVDNDELVCELSSPTISSVAINFERAGYESARLLDEWMRRGKMSLPARIDAPATHVVPRLSTDILAVEDVQLLKALRFIRDRARENVRVADVVRAAGLSRRALENRFRREFGRSILKEIRRVRVDLIAQMLVETDLPVSDIAEALGYENLQHIARYFRKEKQMSLVAFRKRYGAQ
jgi:LacI family transcriptional regulator